MFSRNKGFTLIELVVVIVILGILAVTAAPRFIDLGSDAKKSVIEATHGSIKDTLKMLHMKAQIKSKLGGDVTIKTQYGDYQFYRGYPETKSEATNPNLYFIESFLDFGNIENEVKNNSTRTGNYGDINVFEDNDFSRVGYGTGNLVADLCYVEYHHTSSIETVTIKTQGC